MKVDSTAVLGLQWGDEGKGKIIDFLSETSDVVVRFGGGSNAGHTIVVDGEKFILRLLPSGILHPGKLCLIGPGVACDPAVLQKEIAAIEERGISTSGRVFVDYAAHLVLSIHRDRDNSEETSRGSLAIDTTRRGIGPSYADRVSRIGIRVADLFDHNKLKARAANLLGIRNLCAGKEASDRDAEALALVDEMSQYEELFKGMVDDISLRVMNKISEGKRVLFEGAQGSLLDVDFGTYPYTTSSHTTVGGIFTGLGIPPQYLGDVIGVVKSYMTRVGHGPFPTELGDSTGAWLREKGYEFGSVTGRPRRTGWLDMVSLKRMIGQNGVGKLAITKLDVFDGLSEVMVCEAYDLDGKATESVPPNHPDFFRVKPIYTRLGGWNGRVSGVRMMGDLPKQARAYLEFIEKRTGVPVWLVSTGFGREDTIFLN